MKVVMPILSMLLCLLIIKNTDAMTTDGNDKVVNASKLLEHWANREKHLLPHARQAQQDKSHIASYVSDDGRLRATFDGSTDMVTSYFDDGNTCEVTVDYLYKLLFPPRGFLHDGKIYDRDGNMVADVSIESCYGTPPKDSKKRKNYLKAFKAYCTTKLTRRLTT
jgi:hypothetical protein